MNIKAAQQRRRNILIVDDNVELAQTYKELLEAGDYPVTVERVKPELLRRFVFVSGESGYQKFQPFVRAVESPVFTRPVRFEKLFAGLESFWARGG
jgi:hypothetical protein